MVNYTIYDRDTHLDIGDIVQDYCTEELQNTVLTFIFFSSGVGYHV